jgi:hypothetical protein
MSWLVIHGYARTRAETRACTTGESTVQYGPAVQGAFMVILVSFDVSADP